MNVVHLNTFDVGGAAVAALRLHNGLLKSGVDSTYLSLYKYKFDNLNAFNYTTFLKENFRERIVSSVRYRIQKAIYKKIVGFNYPFSPYNTHNHPFIEEADIIHLHWISQFVNVFSFFSAIKRTKKPIVWTLHDLNPITGGYHYLETNEKLSKENEKYYRLKKEVIKSYNNLHMISPSKWIYDLIIESDFVAKENTHVIKYGIDLQKFVPFSKRNAKEQLNIDPVKKVILFLASDVEDKRKGLNFFLKSIKFLNKKDEVQIICVGEGKFEKPTNIDFLYLGSISETSKLVSIYSAADIFVIPSREDNLPNTIIESFACGTPVVGFDTGGIPDLIFNNYNGYLARKGDEKDLAKKINSLLESPGLLKEFSVNARLFVEENCDIQIQAKKYIELYNLILNKR